MCPKMLLTNDMDDGLPAGGGGAFRFSAVRPDNLGATEYTLVVIAVDNSGSVSMFHKELNDCLKAAVESCQKSPRAENLLIRVIEFNSNPEELHGFRLLNTIVINDYQITQPHGATCLYDSAMDSLGSIQAYGGTLYGQDFNVNGIFIQVTDGEDVCSKYTAKMVAELKANIIAEEKLESMLSILVGINIENKKIEQYLEKYTIDGNFDQFIPAKDANKDTLARLASFISKSISAASQSLGTGGPSQTLATF